MLWVLILSITTALSISFSSNSSIVNYTTAIAEAENNNNNNNFTLLCNISIIACLDNIGNLQNNTDYIKIQTDLILDQVNSTKLKEWIDILSSFPTRNTKSSYIENVAYWLKSELENICEGRVFFHNYALLHNYDFR